MDDPRVITIEGRKVRVIQRTPPVAPTLALMLEGGRGPDGRYWPALRVISRTPLHLAGTTSACLAEDHRLRPWVEGFAFGPDGITRQLRLHACLDCGAVCIRDVSVDTLPGLSSGRYAPRRRDHILGWYTGARPRNRVYGGH